MNEYPKRKHLRLIEYDYSQSNYYFVTICTYGKKHLFGIGDRLTAYGKTAEKCLAEIPRVFPDICIDKYVIMPNHIHVIIRISTNYISEDINGRTECAPTISQVIKNLKENVTRKIGFSVWQKSFHDRILRNEHEYCDAWRYIENNPLNWENDELFSKD